MGEHGVEMAKAGRSTFAALQPVCTQLLMLATSDPNGCAMQLNVLQELLRKEPVAGLQACMDYILFPVLLLLDASVASRTNTAVKKGHMRLVVGDKVAEGVLVCLKLVLETCPCRTIPQMAILLRKITGAAVLLPVEASEEFRHGVVLCLRSLLQSLHKCGSPCSCKNVLLSPFQILRQNPLDLYEDFNDDEEFTTSDFTRVEYSEAEVCPLGYLQSHDMAAAVGHLLSLLLQIAEREGVQGGLGSGKLREDALSTLRTLLIKVGSADALAFFLPGVASGLTKALRSSMVTSRRAVTSGATYKTVGAAGSTDALEESVRGLAELLVLVLADSRNVLCLGPQPNDVGQDFSQVEAALEKLRGMTGPNKDNEENEETLKASSSGESKQGVTVGVALAGINTNEKEEVSSTEAASGGLPWRVERDCKWLEQTVQHVGSLLSESLPLLCAHPAPVVRLAVVEAAAVLLFSCGGTLESCTTLFLDCLLALACDEWQSVASAAHSNLIFLISLSNEEVFDKRKLSSEWQRLQWTRILSRSKLQIQTLTHILHRLLDRLPQAVFAGNETMAVLHARRLASALYFLGPDAVRSTFTETLNASAKFVRIMNQCLGFHSAFTGSINLSTLTTASRSPPLLILLEPKSNTYGDHEEKSKRLVSSEKEFQKVEVVGATEQLPRMPPWLTHSATRLYNTLACIIRLVGRAAISGRPGDTSLMRMVESLLETLQEVATELQQQQENLPKNNFGNGQLQRTSATSACVLNELIYGASGQWSDKLSSFFGGLSSQDGHSSDPWQKEAAAEAKGRISECVGDILHDYLIPENWELPVDSADDIAPIDMPLLHNLQDNAMLQQVLVEGVGVFGIALGKGFEEGGFLALVLYPLLEKLASTNHNVRDAADIALRAICIHSGYHSVKQLVVQNADYVVDSLCRQLRHLALHPHAPSLLTAILRHTGAASDILPLLEEPMRGIVLELEVPARRQHPQYTVPLLRALREIAKAAKVEGGAMLSEASAAASRFKSTLEGFLDLETEVAQQEVEKMITEVQDTEQRRTSVASLATSCLHASAPLLASQDSHTCLLVLDTIEDGVAGLADMEAAFCHLQAQRIAVEDFLQRSANGDGDPDDVKPFGSQDENSNKNNILLPSMNRVWPQLVPCLRHTQPSVLERTLAVIVSISKNCGGHFFSRRIEKDALPLLLKLLQEGPSSIMVRPSDILRPKSSQEIMLLRNQGSEIRESGKSPAAILKVQQAVLGCIKSIAEEKKSAPAVDSVYRPLVAWVVALACKVQALRAPGADTLIALSKIDCDLVWLLVADLAYGSGPVEVLKSPGETFPSFTQIFPPLASPKDSLWVQYAGHTSNFTVDTKAAQELLLKLESSPKLESPFSRCQKSSCRDTND